MKATKLIQTAEWLKDSGEVMDTEYYEEMEEYFRKYEVTEREEWLFQYVVEGWGFKSMLDIVFGKSAYEDGFEGLEQAVKDANVDHIQRRMELGHSKTKTFKEATEDKPEWFRRELARSELDTEKQANYGQEDEYVEFLKEILKEE